MSPCPTPSAANASAVSLASGSSSARVDRAVLVGDRGAIGIGGREVRRAGGDTRSCGTAAILPERVRLRPFALDCAGHVTRTTHLPSSPAARPGMGEATGRAPRGRGRARASIVDRDATKGEAVAADLGGTLLRGRRHRRRVDARPRSRPRSSSRRCARASTARASAGPSARSTAPATRTTSTGSARSSRSTSSARSTCCGSRRRAWRPTSPTTTASGA